MVTETVLHVGPNKYRIYLVVLNCVFIRETCPVSGVRKDSNFVHTWTECDMNIIKQHFHCIIIMLFSCLLFLNSAVFTVRVSTKWTNNNDCVGALCS